LLGLASLASILGAAFGLTVAARPSVLTNALAVGVSADDTCGRRFFLDLSGGLKSKAEGDGIPPSPILLLHQSGELHQPWNNSYEGLGDQTSNPIFGLIAQQLAGDPGPEVLDDLGCVFHDKAIADIGWNTQLPGLL
jgi:hypothetical protein